MSANHKKNRALGRATRAIHAGLTPDALTGAVMTPSYQTSTYKLEELGKYTNGNDYGRTNNPTRAADPDVVERWL